MRTVAQKVQALPAILDRLQSIALIAHRAKTELERSHTEGFLIDIASEAYDDLALDLVQLERLVK